MKLSRKIFEVGLLIFGLIMLCTYIFNSTRETPNILENMKDGMRNESILMHYQEEIDEVRSTTNGTITIMYYDVDLNGDNYIDRIVSIVSPLHSGARGDTLEILLNDGKTYTRMQNSFCIRLYKQDSEKTPVSVINILENKTNGFCDIGISTDENNCVLRYKDGNYQVDGEVESWVGTYKYVETFPHGLDEEFNYFIGYTINIYEENGEYYANITGNGWQLCSESLARIEGNETSIDLVFIKTLPNDSSFGRSERYDEDSVLLSFTRKDDGLQTEWGLLRKEHPIFIEREDEIVGEYFIKIRGLK